MRIAREKLPDGTSRLIDTNGQPLGSGDIDQPMLHVIPLLYVPDDQLVDKVLARLTLTVRSEDGLPIAPDPAAADGGVVVRNPYPNKHYFVGGSREHRHGWLIPLADGCNKRVFSFCWRLRDAFEVGFAEDNIDIVHHVTLRLVPGAGRLYTMHASCWPDDAAAQAVRDRLMVCLVSPSPHPGDPEARLFHDDVWRTDTKVRIPGIPREQAHSLDSFEEENLHEITQTAIFPDADPDRDAHRANAPVEMPAALFVQAVRLAREIPRMTYGHNGVPAECEQHPAVRLLCDWWNTARPAGEPLRPGSFMLWVRVRPDGEYWSGYYETPNIDVRDMNPNGANCARVGDALLMLFQAEQADAQWDESGVTIRLPNGEPHMTVGVDRKDFESGAYDEAWYGLESLRVFPERFPAWWAVLPQDHVDGPDIDRV